VPNYGFQVPNIEARKVQKRSKKFVKGTVARDFVAHFFIPIDRPYLGDGLLRGINFGRCACAEKRAFYMLSRMLKRATNAHFRYNIALPVGINLHPQRSNSSGRGSNEKNP